LTPTISILLANYNDARYLRDSLAGILGQTDPADEVIVVDDGSTDETVEILARYSDPRIRVVGREHRGLQALAETYRTAMDLSDAPLLAILDGDDRWPRNKLQLQVPDFDDPAGWLRHLVLPALTVGLVAAAIMTRYVRSAVLEVASMGYVRTARSKGLPPRVVTFRHTVRNALVPVLTITGIQLATILGGVIVVEVVFAWPGLGRLVYNAVAARDYPVIQGAVLLIATLFLIINLVVDVLYAVVDPRIRLA